VLSPELAVISRFARRLRSSAGCHRISFVVGTQLTQNFSWETFFSLDFVPTFGGSFVQDVVSRLRRISPNCTCSPLAAHKRSTKASLGARADNSNSGFTSLYVLVSLGAEKLAKTSRVALAPRRVAELREGRPYGPFSSGKGRASGNACTRLHD
jgi:hypothetical protein